MIKEKGLDEKDVYISASFSEDYLSIQAIHIREQNEQETQDEYKEQLSAWQEEQVQRKENEIRDIQQRIEILQKQKARIQ